MEVGTEGILGGQAVVKDVAGTWKDLTDNVNMMAYRVTSQVRDVAVVAKAVAQGDLSKKVTADAQGEVLELKNTMNQMVCNQPCHSSYSTSVSFCLLLGGSTDLVFG